MISVNSHKKNITNNDKTTVVHIASKKKDVRSMVCVVLVETLITMISPVLGLLTSHMGKLVFVEIERWSLDSCLRQVDCFGRCN